MKNKAFTLVELLAVLTILAVIVTIVLVSVNSTIDTSRQKLSDIQIKEVERAAKAYNISEGNLDSESSCVNISTLISNGYLDGEKIIDPKDKEEMTGSVKITKVGEKYSYKYQEDSCE